MINVLVIYSFKNSPFRKSVWDHLNMFRNSQALRVKFLNISFQGLPKAKPDFDIFVLHTSLLAERWSIENFEAIRIEFAKSNWFRDVYSVAFPQDEFFRSFNLDSFLVNNNVNHIYGLVSMADAPKIYLNSMNSSGYTQVVSGFVGKSGFFSRGKRFSSRKIFAGYRAWAAEPWLGNIARDKLLLASLADVKVPADIKMDVSCDPNHQKIGRDWYQFIKDCKWILASPGGASIVDVHGELEAHYRSSHFPNSTVMDFDEAYRYLGFANFDGYINLSVLTPRIIEAAQLGTPLIAFDSEYNGVLKANRDYLKLERDFSNLGEVFELAQDPEIWLLFRKNLQNSISNAHSLKVEYLVSQVIANFIPFLLQKRPIALEVASRCAIAIRFDFYIRIMFRVRLLFSRYLNYFIELYRKFVPKN